MHARRDFLHYALAFCGVTASSCGRPFENDQTNREKTNMANHLNIGALIYPEMDQIDFTGPFEVLSRLPDSTFHILWKEKKPLRGRRRWRPRSGCGVG